MGRHGFQLWWSSPSPSSPSSRGGPEMSSSLAESWLRSVLVMAVLAWGLTGGLNDDFVRHLPTRGQGAEPANRQQIPIEKQERNQESKDRIPGVRAEGDGQRFLDGERAEGKGQRVTAGERAEWKGQRVTASPELEQTAKANQQLLQTNQRDVQHQQAYLIQHRLQEEKLRKELNQQQVIAHSTRDNEDQHQPFAARDENFLRQNSNNNVLPQSNDPILPTANKNERSNNGPAPNSAKDGNSGFNVDSPANNHVALILDQLQNSLQNQQPSKQLEPAKQGGEAVPHRQESPSSDQSTRQLPVAGYLTLRDDQRLSPGQLHTTTSSSPQHPGQEVKRESLNNFIPIPGNPGAVNTGQNSNLNSLGQPPPGDSQVRGAGSSTAQTTRPQVEIGGVNINWDWEDFSIMFNSYGGAEMKVRRSPHPSTGEPWPLPQYYTKKEDKVFKVSRDLHFTHVGEKCDILEEAFSRHIQRILRGAVEDMYDNLQNAEGSPIEDPTLRYARPEFVTAPLISRVEVKVRKPCTKYPSLDSDESYDLVVKTKKSYIWANEVWGALRGLETLGHLVWKGTDDSLYIKETVISDYPRFPHRGLLVDTSRHFLFKEVLLDILDCMEMNKLNVFHWHIVDDQSFPYESKVFPELSRKGAYHPSYVYSLQDIAEIIEYARLRGIRVMPEFDTPGHTYAWGFSRPELLTQCYSGTNPVKGYFGPMDPSKNSTYRFLQSLFEEIVEVFQDQYLHLGGDEVPMGCWQSNPEVLAFAKEVAKLPRPTQQSGVPVNSGGWSPWSDEIRRVYEYYENRLITIINEIGQKKKKSVKYVMWQEVMNNNLQLPNDTIIQVWMGDMGDVNRATSMGYQVIYSTCWYMDHVEYGTKWPKYYNCDPVDQSFGYRIDEKKVLGGEAAFWAEYFSNENLISLMWPRASAAAERLWSSREVKNLDHAAVRLTEHRCRMLKRGINVGEINGPGYCLHVPPKRRFYNETQGCRGGNCSHTHSLIEKVFVSQSVTDCSSMLPRLNTNVLLGLVIITAVLAALFALSKSSNRFHRWKNFKNRYILIVFVVVTLVYFLFYTTIWIRGFEFSGSFHRTVQEDNESGAGKNEIAEKLENLQSVGS